MKRIIAICALVMPFGCWQVRAVLATGINAIVHDSVVTYHDVDMLTEQTADLLRSQYGARSQEYMKRMSKVREENLERLTERELILHEFKTAGYAIPDSVVNDMVEERLRRYFGDRRTATKTLQARGMTYEQFREQEKERFIIDAMRNKNISSEIIISPRKIENYYAEHSDKFRMEDQVKMRLISLTKSSDTGAPDARKLCEEILVAIKGGASFAEMAKEHGQNSEAKNGGERDWDNVQDLRPELGAAVRSLQPGQISDVIETPQACYLIKVEQEREAHVKPLTEVRDQIEAELTDQEQQRLEKLWIDKLKKKTFVRYFP